MLFRDSAGRKRGDMRAQRPKQHSRHGGAYARFNNADRQCARHPARGPLQGHTKTTTRCAPHNAARAAERARASPSARPQGERGTRRRRAIGAHPRDARDTASRGRARRYPRRGDTPPPRLHRGRCARTHRAAAHPRTGNPCTAPAAATAASPVSAEGGGSRHIQHKT